MPIDDFDYDIDEMEEKAKSRNTGSNEDDGVASEGFLDQPAPFYNDLEREEAHLTKEELEERGDDYHFAKLIAALGGAHAARMSDLLHRMPDNQFRTTYMTLIEYAIPKLARTTAEAKNVDNKIETHVEVQARDGSEAIEIANEINSLNEENKVRQLHKPTLEQLLEKQGETAEE